MDSLPALGLLAAESTVDIGFNIATKATSTAFSVSRAFLSPFLSGGGALLDHAFGLEGLASTALHGVLDVTESIALAGIGVGKGVTNSVLKVSSNTVRKLHGRYGNDQALRALETFVALVRRESSVFDEFSKLETSRAAATWVALSNSTPEYYGRRIVAELEELDLKDWVESKEDTSEDVIFEVTEESVLSGGEEIVEASVTGESRSTREETMPDLLRRYSRLCLGSYGGMGMIFFGVKLPTFDTDHLSPNRPGPALTPTSLSNLSRELDEAPLANAFSNKSSLEPTAATMELDEELDEELGTVDDGWMEGEPELDSIGNVEAEKKPGFWSLLAGNHDLALLESLGGVFPGSSKLGGGHHDDSDGDDDPAAEMRNAARRERVRKEKKARSPPRYFVVCDHSKRHILLVLRGTLSLDDIATDLACAPTPFDETLYWDLPAGTESKSTYAVHSGMFEVALAMGNRDGPVTRAIAKAMQANESYDVHLVGHSLGAGVASLLATLWVNPETGTTNSRSGLPPGRRMKVFAFAPPCTTDPLLARAYTSTITSFVNSSDAVPRFSLGHIRDLASAVVSLSRAGPSDNPTKILTRLLAYRAGFQALELRTEERLYFEALRATVEADMQCADLFPPGTVLWATRKGDLVLPGDEEKEVGVRLWKVGKTEVVFQQMLLTGSMLSAHLPHSYVAALLFGEVA